LPLERDLERQRLYPEALSPKRVPNRASATSSYRPADSNIHWFEDQSSTRLPPHPTKQPAPSWPDPASPAPAARGSQFEFHIQHRVQHTNKVSATIPAQPLGESSTAFGESSNNFILKPRIKTRL
jgi:hypothetical protein